MGLIIKIYGNHILEPVTTSVFGELIPVSSVFDDGEMGLGPVYRFTMKGWRECPSTLVPGCSQDVTSHTLFVSTIQTWLGFTRGISGHIRSTRKEGGRLVLL